MPATVSYCRATRWPGFPADYGNAIIDNSLSLLATITTTDDLTPSMDAPMTPQFTVPAVADAVAAASGDRVLITRVTTLHLRRDRRAVRRGSPSYLHSQGLDATPSASSLAGHEVGQDLLGIYAYNGPEYVE